MSGTSCDGTDAVAVEITGAEPLTVHVAAHHQVAYEPGLRSRLLSVREGSVDDLSRLHVELGARFGHAARAAIDAAGWAPGDVLCVAVAGHTAVHLPPDGEDPGATLALGDGDVVAETSGCATLSDFRARDRAAGGHGAPLVPFADACLLRTADRVRAALNLGGIANLTVVPPVGDPVAFDTGPANMLLDETLRRATDGAVPFDEGGLRALAGRADRGWVEQTLAADAFVARAPPKSTGRERYGATFLDRHEDTLERLALADRLATLARYTVESVAYALEQHVPERPEELVVSGGGALNRCLMDGLTARLPSLRVLDSRTALGLDVFTREAVSFAILADATLRGVPCNVPSVTGARRAVTLGKLSPAPGGRFPG